MKENKENITKVEITETENGTTVTTEYDTSTPEKFNAFLDNVFDMFKNN